MVHPIHCHVQARSLNTARTLLELAAVQLGLLPEDAKHLRLKLGNDEVKSRTRTLAELGFRNHTEFRVKGPVTVIRKARTIDVEGVMKLDRRSSLELIRALCTYCPERIHETAPTSWTLLHYAAFRNTPETVQLLLEAKADPYVQDKAGRTAVDLARCDDHQHLATSLSRVWSKHSVVGMLTDAMGELAGQDKEARSSSMDILINAKSAKPK
eukprot:TRINITY_DN34121_c0_g1_i1.p1 TRINITY_DN34121_c0_g1~~TRINITY_DN34121_c0_g1_i1.p1  ORF type:complete len:212 (+),score=51.10 TRINITY_DN34121_c0_g1_i1:71-706(+)